MGNDATIKFGYDGAALNAGLRSQESSIGNFAIKTEQRFKGLGTAIKGYLTFAAIKGVGSFITGQLDSADELLDLSTKIGTSAESIQRLAVIGKVGGGLDVETITSSLAKLQKVMAGLGDDKGAAEAFADLGLEAGRFATLEPDRQLIALADAFQEAQASGKGLKAIYELFGKSAGDLIPIISMGKEELEKLAAQPVVSEENLLRLAKAADGIDAMKSAASNLAKEKVLSATLSDEERTKLEAEVDARKKQQEAVRNATAAQIENAAATGSVAEATTKAAEADAEAAQRKTLSLKLLKQETAVLDLQARGQTKKADAMQKSIDIEKRARQVSEDTGMDLGTAKAFAEREAEQKQRITDRENGVRKIRGVKRGAGRMMGSGIDEFNRLQQRDANGNHYDAFESPGGRFGGRRGGPLADVSGSLSTRNRSTTGAGVSSTSNSSQYTGMSVQQASRIAAAPSSAEALGAKLDELIKISAAGLLGH
jgi:hypothetical protein